MMGYWRAPRSVAYISTDEHVSNEPLPLWGELARTTASQWGMQWLSSSQGPMASGMNNSENIPQTHSAELLSLPS